MSAKWFSIKTLYRSFTSDRAEKPDRFYDPDATLVEERVLLIKAKNATEATKKAEREAQDYVKRSAYLNPYGQKIVTKYLGYYEVFSLLDNPADKVEVFSTTRVMSKHIKDGKIAHVYIGKKESKWTQSKRKKFVNKEYEQA